ncbi:MAG: metallophosphoesterase [Candidatus Pseudobacter hemicellulosilyticus]|uniref:Metallophosphoesterase n=1 Tax=Candidatus Pseudobacter hemicellulosilyticus TaxID=3121375 RepID=A0AAJ5WRZ4_9BACT|nr:MAG: metallophosphoesterase [Pseudobacter sp.]
MKPRYKIALQIPYKEDQKRSFSFRLHSQLTNEPTEYKSSKKIFVVSDIEGNFTPFCKLLVSAKVIDRKLNWTFGEGHLVIVGDCFDRGEEVMECLWLIYALEEKAKFHGGYVHFILGNHEIMNLNGDWRYVHPKYAEDYFSERYPLAALYDGSNELLRWLCTKNIIEKIGPILFVHGGISPELLQFNLSISDINSYARQWYCRTDETYQNILAYILFSADHSPVWYRGYYTEELAPQLIQATLDHFGVTTIVTGHTLIEKVTRFYDGKLFNVDTDHANGKSEGLLIINNKRFYRVERNGKTEKLI